MDGASADSSRNFCDILLKRRPDIIGKTVYFFANRIQSLKCKVNENGTISVVECPGKQFRTANDLVSSIKAGSLKITQNFKIPERGKDKFQFSRDLYFTSDRRLGVKTYVDHDALPLPLVPADNAKRRICPGFTINHPVLRNIDCSSIKFDDNGRLRSLVCKKDKKMDSMTCAPCRDVKIAIRNKISHMKKKHLLCSGVVGFKDVIEAKGWNGARRQCTSLVINGDTVRSPSCTGLKKPKAANCAACAKARHLLNTSRHRRKLALTNGTTRTHRLKYSAWRYLTEEEKAEKAAIITKKKKLLANSIRILNANVNRPKIDFAKKNFVKIVQQKHRGNDVTHSDLSINAEASNENGIFVCQWADCKFKTPFESSVALLNHVVTTHVYPPSPPPPEFEPEPVAVDSEGEHSNAILVSEKVVRPRKSGSGKKISDSSNGTFGIDITSVMGLSALAGSNPKLRYGAVVFAEKNISSSPNTQAPGGQPSGSRKLPQRVLVFQFVTIFSDQPHAINVAYLTTGDMRAESINKRFWQVVSTLHSRGLYVLAAVCDGVGSNRTFLYMHLGKNPCDRIQFFVENKLAPGRKIFLFSDPNRLIFKLRNDWAATLRNLKKDGYCVSWHHIKFVRAWQKRVKEQRGRYFPIELSDEHFRLSNYNVNSMPYINDVFSEEIESNIAENLADSSKGTRDFMAVGRILWESINNDNVMSNAEDAYATRARLEHALQYFCEWKAAIDRQIQNISTPGTAVDKAAVHNLQMQFVSHEFFEDLNIFGRGVLDFMEFIFNDLPRIDPEAQVHFSVSRLNQKWLDADLATLENASGCSSSAFTPENFTEALRSENARRLTQMKERFL